MSIARLFQEKSVVFSCEVFPPKKTSPIETVYRTLDQLQDLRPDYISVTFGAGGSAGDNLTGRIAAAIQDQYHIPSVAHLSCVNYTRDEVAGLLDGLKAMGIENILALRGDMDPNHPPKTDFQYASQLIAFIKSRDNSFHLSGACYPEGHIESPDMVSDILNLKKKVDAGAEHLVSQLFFDNDDFYDFREKARIAGINVPIQAGIMPVLNKSQIERMVYLCGASIPKKLARMLSRYGDHPAALRDAGIAYAIDQISDLVASGVEGIHLYTMNNAGVARAIFDRVSTLFTV
ncbi:MULTISPECIES: methylenetetrahydrofolate reductase [NAD(P)H] [Intestinimonas]|uniref:methylenetetrahydrofolate reductase [NAD(P)H] n=1 Tax=Intestinimonas TaxID=1392389 RepID=UPI00067F1AEC|nr:MULTISPECIES: methylenetetrahydrofolate reductase [NAD(P)H] [Intestinimonas]MBS6283394.1 methylenetetrahydrofolate reductase [NAD(P)H] [Oscillospiraceae bacterium]